MTPIPVSISDFIHKHHIFTLATSSDNQPYTCTCFYVFLDDLNLFVFTSDRTTRHIAEAEIQPRVAGAIALETSIVGKIQGIQFTGQIRKLQNNELKISENAYIRKFPVAILKETTLWGIEPDFIKMTHNRLGFGKKLIWNKTE
jgi:uncharacterized protein YhbP (UPF0306 family)